MTINCRQIDEYLDRSLSAEQILEFDAHIESCPDCRHEAAVDSLLDSSIRQAWCGIVAPDGLSEKLAVGANRRTADRSVWPTVILSVAATLVAMVTIAAVVTNQSASPVADHPALSPTGRPTLESGPLGPVIVMESGNAEDALLVRSSSSSARFTIVKAYRPRYFKNPDPINAEGSKNDQEN